MHKVGNEQCSRTRDARSTVYQYVALLPFLLNESKDRKEGISHFLISLIPQVQLIDLDFTIKKDVEIYTTYDSCNLVFPQRCLILGKMHATEPNLSKPCLSIEDLLSLIEKSRHF